MSEKTLRKESAAPAVAETPVATLVAPGPSTPAPLGGLVVGSATDPAEAAADAMAATALARASGAPDAHQHGPGCDHVRRSAMPTAAPTIGMAGGALDVGAAQAIDGRRGQGDRLPDHTLRRMESGFGRSFSSVRIHTDGAAAGLAGGMSAAAFTTGNDVFFGAGQFRPGTPDGDHMIAHELAHVVQDSGTVHRSFLDRIGKAIGLVEKTDDEKAAEAAAALAKKDKKDKKAADKAAQKKEAAENKEKVGKHKELEKSHQAGQKADRVVGTASRAGTAKGISDEVTGNEAAGKGKTSQKANDLRVEFDKWLAKEKALYLDLVGPQGMNQEVARNQAYKQIWLTDAPAEIKAIRPPRETAAERLTSAVREERGKEAEDTDRESRGALGSLLSKKVEMVYERAETEFDKLVERHPEQLPDFLRQAVEVTIWAKVPADIRDKRPTDQRIEMKAREDARKRLNLRPTPTVSKKAPESSLDPHIANTETVSSGVGAVEMAGKGAKLVLKQVGKPKDKILQAGDPKSDDPVEATVAEKIPGPIGGFAKEVRKVQNRVAKGEKDDKPDPIKATSDETKAAAGIGAVTGILSGLMATVQGIMTSCKAIAKAHEERTARNILAATKASSDAVKAAAGTAKGIASFAGSFDAGVQNAVASFVPGLNIGIAALGLISNGCDLADVAMRMHETNNAVFDTRLRGMSGDTAEGPDVLIFPLLKVAATYTKKLEQASWSTGVSVSDLATSIATVASGGGYGIPVAVQAGVKVVDLLHSLGHIIADDVLARISQKSRADATGVLEGSAEQQLKNDPSMAIDALIVQARKGDAIAVKFVTGYDIKPDELQNGKLSELRGKMLGTMGLDADPLTMFQKFKKGMASVKSAAGAVSDKFTATGQMATERNAMDGKTRGFGWRVKMMFKGQVKFNRSVNKTETLTGRKLGETDPVYGPQNREALVFIGTFALPMNPTEQEVETFLTAAKGFPDSVLTNALADKRNTLQEAQDTLLYIIADKAALAASA